MTMDGVSGLIAGIIATEFAAMTLDGAMVSIEMVVKIAVPIGGVVWWLSSKFTKLDSRLHAIETALKRCPVAKDLDCDEKTD